MDERLQERLNRLGVRKGTRHLRVPPLKRYPEKLPVSPLDEISFRPPDDLDEEDLPALAALLPGGTVVETAVGGCFVVDRVYPLTYRHGSDQLADLLALPLEPAVPLLRDESLRNLDFRQFLFLDTETTGLAGAGTLAFMVGVAFIANEALIVRQYFLRDHGDEAAMLTLLNELLAEKAGLITFNGRSFDLPLLDGRFLINRMFSDLLDLPHLDLLHPARRLWRSRLGSCALGSLEETLLGVHRTQEDIPGWLIPGLYQDYLRTGDARELLRVFYHNQIDMLSMVTLAARIFQLLATVAPEPHPIDQVSLGKWQADAGLHADAEASLRSAVSNDLPLEIYHTALGQLGLLLKRQERRDEAVVIWQQLAATSFDTIEAHVELAKHFEWQHGDLQAAIHWTKQGMALAENWDSSRVKLVRGDLEHRLARLLRKQQGNGG